MYVIFSPTNGFWITDFGWSFSPEEADILDQESFDFYEANPSKLPCIGINDIKLVEKDKWSHIGYEELEEKIIAIAENSSPESLVELANSIGELQYEYQDDSLFQSTGDTELLSFLDVVTDIKEALPSLERDDLARIYHAVQENKVIKDDQEGFYHEMVLKSSQLH